MPLPYTCKKCGHEFEQPGTRTETRYGEPGRPFFWEFSKPCCPFCHAPLY